jgi:cysteinyl-tRNA synthetase
MSSVTRINVTTSRPSWGAVNDFTYVLQDISLTAIGATKFDAVIIDYSRDGSDAGRFTKAQINAHKYSSGGPKRVLAYISVGEAEDYRWYWNPSWDANHDGKPDPGAPSWLGPQNPDWPGNYKVKYWDPGWQKIVHQYLAKIIATGYDGAYLDVIDAYLYWGPGGESGFNRATAEAEMVSFVKSLAQDARVTHGIAGFAIVPQNGEELSVHPDYVAVVTGIGEEDVWYNGNTRQPWADTAAVLRHLDVFKHAGKVVFVIDYVTKSSLIDDFYAKAQARGYVPYATVRDLDVLTINPGHKPN